jgi:hypothetical protein
MTLPLDARSPRQQQRMVEVYNAGTEAPAFAVLEVYDSTVPDGDDSRTVFHVRQVTDPTKYAVLCNGMTPLSGYGFATGDLPAWALCSSTTAGDKVGPVVGSWELTAAGSGFVVCGGDYNGATRVERLSAGKSDVLAIADANVKCDEENWVSLKVSPSPYELATGGNIAISAAWNRFKIKILAGDALLLKWDEKYDRWIVAQVEHQCVTALVDVWDTDACFVKIGVCFSAPGAVMPVADVDEGCLIWNWTVCDSSSAAGTCLLVWPGGACDECPPSSSGS